MYCPFEPADGLRSGAKQAGGHRQAAGCATSRVPHAPTTVLISEVAIDTCITRAPDNHHHTKHMKTDKLSNPHDSSDGTNHYICTPCMQHLQCGEDQHDMGNPRIGPFTQRMYVCFLLFCAEYKMATVHLYCPPVGLGPTRARRVRSKENY
jgi:hypothetical protein